MPKWACCFICKPTSTKSSSKVSSGRTYFTTPPPPPHTHIPTPKLLGSKAAWSAQWFYLLSGAARAMFRSRWRSLALSRRSSSLSAASSSRSETQQSPNYKIHTINICHTINFSPFIKGHYTANIPNMHCHEIVLNPLKLLHNTLDTFCRLSHTQNIKLRLIFGATALYKSYYY